MPRTLSQFTGKCLILGGGWDDGSDRSNDPSNFEKFYTVDINPEANPDLVMDFTDANAWKQFRDASFDFIFFEHVGFSPNIHIAFQECQRVLSGNGIIMYCGGFRKEKTPYKSFMELFASENFTYLPYRPPVASKRFIEKFGSEQGTEGFAIKNSNKLNNTFLIYNLPIEARKIVHHFLSEWESYNRQKALFSNKKDGNILYDGSSKPGITWLKLNSTDFLPIKKIKIKACSVSIGQLPVSEDNTKSADFELWYDLEMKLEAEFALKGQLNYAEKTEEVFAQKESKQTSNDVLVQPRLNKKRPHTSDELHDTSNKVFGYSAASQTFFTPSPQADATQKMSRNNRLA